MPLHMISHSYGIQAVFGYACHGVLKWPGAVTASLGNFWAWATSGAPCTDQMHRQSLEVETVTSEWLSKSQLKATRSCALAPKRIHNVDM